MNVFSLLQGSQTITISDFDQQRIVLFQGEIYKYFAEYGRSFPWRETYDPYAIFVSEIMLAQTQTSRVIPKYYAWMDAFPTINVLASASLKQVLYYWSGLGYNRRACYLLDSAKKIVQDHDGVVPSTTADLRTLPGVGRYIAGAILAFAYNQPQVFIETNIRTVYLYHFFRGRENVSDAEIFPLIEKTIDNENPRQWYYALMDYGAMLKRKVENPSRKSAHHIQQKKFIGSDRQIRGKIIKMLINEETISEKGICMSIDADSIRIAKILNELVYEGFIKKVHHTYSIV